MKNILLFLLLIPFSTFSQQFSLEGLGNQSGILPIDGSTDELIVTLISLTLPHLAGQFS